MVHKCSLMWLAEVGCDATCNSFHSSACGALCPVSAVILLNTSLHMLLNMLSDMLLNMLLIMSLNMSLGALIVCMR